MAAQAVQPPVDPAIQQTPFWTDQDQMALTIVARRRLGTEGLVFISDFIDFKTEELKEAFKNIRTTVPAQQGIPAVVDENGDELYAAIPPVPADVGIILSAKCTRRLKVASTAFHYYTSIVRACTVGNMNYLTVLKDFQIEYEALEKLAKETKPTVPTLSRTMTPIRWVESFKDCVFRTYGVRDTPLSYVIRDDAEVPSEVKDPLLPLKPFGETGSILMELVKRMSHDDPLYKTDNGSVYSMLEVATRGTIYATTIKPFSRLKDGRKAWMAFISSHVGEDKWETMQNEKQGFLMNTKWNGKIYSLEKFLGQHRSAYVQLEEAAMHVNIQLPTEHTRVGYLLKNINNNDPDLRAAIGSIRINTNGMRDDFEKSVTTLLPVCPYAKHKNATISRSGTRNPSVSSLKNTSDSSTGVDLRWHTPSEYAKLSKSQRSELYEWQQSNEGKKQISNDYAARKNSSSSNSSNSTKLTKKQLIARVKSLEGSNHENDEPNYSGPTIDEMTACIASAIKDNINSDKHATAEIKQNEKKRKVSFIDDKSEAAYKVAANALQNIMKRHKPK